MRFFRFAPRTLALVLPLIAACSEADDSAPPVADSAAVDETSTDPDTGVPDTGSVDDTSVVVEDTGAVEDTGSATDTGASGDTGAADTGTAMDTGSVTDSGTPDTGVVVDSGTPDTGTALDSGTPMDSAAPMDSAMDSAPEDSTVADTAPEAAAPSCTDGVKNGSESDIDCGGTCAPCSSGRACVTGADCKSLACSASVCSPTCSDGEKNGGESDVDCGGTCGACGVGKMCNTPADCGGGLCVENKCTHPTSCKALHASSPALGNAVYRIDPDGAGSVAPFDVYCDMTSDGGGWTKILQVASGSGYTVTTGALGNVAVAGAPAHAKLSDAQINAIGGAATKTYRYTGGNPTYRLYLQSGSPYVDTAISMNLMSGGAKLTCVAASIASCGFVSKTRATIDTLHMGMTDDSCARWFVDHDADVPHCWNTPETGATRCFNTGASCAPAPYPQITQMEMWVRE